MKFGKLAVLTFSLSLAGATAASAAPVTVSGSVALALAGVVAPYSLLPSAQFSFFQIGTISLSRSMAKRHASKASAR